MENEFNKDVLRQRLITLPFWKQLAFQLAICLRLMPNFSIFAREVGAGGEQILLNAISTAWSNLLSGVSSVNLSAEAIQCESVAPDTENYSSIYVSTALDAAIAISLLMKAFSEGNSEYIVESAALIRDSVDMYVQELEQMDPRDPSLEDKILNHELMQNELKRQREDFSFLAGLDDDIFISVNTVKQKWFDSAQSCLNLKL